MGMPAETSEETVYDCPTTAAMCRGRKPVRRVSRGKAVRRKLSSKKEERYLSKQCLVVTIIFRVGMIIALKSTLPMISK
jgi:hypothetical protein